jgi:hypothetical protein
MPHIYDGTGRADWRSGLRQSRMLVMLWSAAPQHQALQRQKLAYAQQLGKPIRVLHLEHVRLPEDLCAGYADVQVAQVQTEREAVQQIQAWLAELPPPDTQGSPYG